MKLTTLLLITVILQVSAKSYAQKITLSEKNVPINRIFDQIRSQSGYDFLVTRAMIKQANLVSIDVKNEELAEVLKKVFADQPLDFKIEDKAVIVSKKILPETIRPKVIPATPITGRVTDAKGVTIPGVSVYNKTKQKGVASNAEGDFTIDASAGDVLLFTAIGFAKQEITVGTVNKLEITLKEQLSNLNEVVVVGYNTQRKTDITGSLVTVQAKDLQNSAVSNPLQALEGKTPGLRVTQNSSQPGVEGVSLNIRGPNSFASNNSPLVLINGVVGDMTDLDPSSIETITVLKDAASAAIYGARAANGVILVTTKTGANDTGMHVTFNSSYINQNRINNPERIWNSAQYMNMYNTAVDNAANGSTKYDQASIDLFKTPSKQYPSFNWDKFIIKPIGVFNNTVSIGGKNGNTSIQANLGSWSQDGIVRGFNYNKYTGLFSIESQLSKKFKLGFTANGLVDNQKEPYNGVQDAILATFAQKPDFEPTLSDGSGRYTRRSFPFEYPGKNPYALANEGGQWTNRFVFNATAYTRFNILDNLVWEVKGGMRSNESDIKWQAPATPVYNYLTNQPDGYSDDHSTIELRETNDVLRYYTIYSTLNYKATVFKDLNLDALFGASREKSTITELQGYRRGFASQYLDVISAGPTEGQTSAGTANEYSLASLFGKINLNYQHKYLFEADFRRDGSSRFPPTSKYAVFPAFSAGWHISQEPFIANNLKWLDELKLRASYGKLGNDNVNGYYPYQSTLSPGANYPFSTLQGGVALTNLVDERLKWEETTTKNLGLDFNIGNSIIYGTFDYFQKNTSGILRQQQIPGYAGVGSPYVNEGVVKNKGFELTLGHRGHIGEFTYGADFNISAYKNKVTSFGAPEYGASTEIKEGVEINRYYMYQADGIYQSQQEIDKGPTPLWVESPGDVRIKDVTGDGKITPDDRVGIDGINPKYYYGFNLYAKYKGFDLNVFFQGEQGRKVLVNSEDNLILPFAHATAPLAWWEDSWTPENPSATVPKMDLFGGPLGASTRATSTFWLRDASYMRLKNLTLGYTFPAQITKKLSIQRLRLFLSGENLLIFTKFKFGDPESNWFKNGNPSQGGTSPYPMLRSLTCGLSVQF